MDTPMRLHIRITLMKRLAFVIEQRKKRGAKGNRYRGHA